MKQRKMPLRKCTGCGEMKEKRELIRVVKAPDTKDENGEIIAKGEISLDLTGRKAGRGAYVCRNLACFEKARKARRFERSLSCKIPDEVYEQMQSELAAADSERIFYERQDFVAAWHLQEGRQADYRCRHDD